ncbi:recombinase family protein [Nocardia sp. NPDC004168]|uniref:recombinase family protein n=1 Tax=Nocardia sp. NPDC004168 TaxID=3154452 RepID=UPI0033BD86A1
MRTHAANAAGKVTHEHLRREAYLYVRQSSLKQVLSNTESATRQYALRGRAVALGWTESQIIVIDTDQGQSGASAADREGFQRLVADVGMGRAGIVLGLEVSRLARNNTDWHRLLEICALTGTLICDEDGLYDPADFNDRLLLGLKGTMSEAELHFLKARLRGGQLSKARRGELVMPLPVGLIRDGTGAVTLDPDASVQGAVRRVFDTFTATGSALAVVKAFAADQLLFPRRLATGPRKGELSWGELEHSRVLQILHNPRYAGAFFYGRNAHARKPGGGQTTRVLPREEWTVLITDAHVGYITWERFEANQARLTANATAHGTDRRASPPREGPALLQGLVLCGKCGGRMTVRYHQRKNQLTPEYVCQSEGIKRGKAICQRVPGASIDTAVGTLLLDTLTPLALQTALAVSDELTARAEDADRIRATTVQRAQYHADLARRRYLAVDPANRLVADQLEAAWNAALRDLSEATETYERAHNSHNGPLNQAQRDKVTALASDFPALWNNPNTPMRERKRIVRLLVTDATLARNDTTITVHIRLRGGQDHTLTLPIPLASWQIRQTPTEVVTAVDTLLDEHTDSEIATILTGQGLTSGTGGPLHPGIIRHIRHAYQLRSHTQRLRDQGLLTLNEIARHLNISPNTVKTWRNNGLLTGKRANDKGEYLYQLPSPDLARPRIGRPPRKPAPANETTTASTTRSAV